jgi:hypothetical protein
MMDMMEKLILNNDRSFEHWMAIERTFSECERELIHHFDFKKAERCRKRRFQCMELALDSLSKGQMRTPRWRGAA